MQLCARGSARAAVLYVQNITVGVVIPSRKALPAVTLGAKKKPPISDINVSVIVSQ
jgi:hypothetical protein